MDPALLAVATSGANALVSLMTTDLWERAKVGVSSIFSRFSKSASSVPDELENSRGELIASAERDDLPETTEELQQMWVGKFRRLLVEHPEAAAELQEIITLWRDHARDNDINPGNTIHQTATAYDNSRIYQQGSGVQNNN
ncbi:hypothetical protein G3I30_29235 [Actinospica acidiphila]|nr:hypothetical protein [Actinospica acidiphila]